MVGFCFSGLHLSSVHEVSQLCRGAVQALWAVPWYRRPPCSCGPHSVRLIITLHTVNYDRVWHCGALIEVNFICLFIHSVLLLGKTLRCSGKRFRTCMLLSRYKLSFWTVAVTDVCKLLVNTKTWLYVCVFTLLGGKVVLWRAQEGVRQSPRTTEASNSLKIFNIYLYEELALWIWNCFIKHDGGAYPYCACSSLSIVFAEWWADELRGFRSVTLY